MFMTLCEYASLHKDGTVSLLRCGIEHWETATLPITLALMAYAELDAAELPPGTHDMALRVTKADGGLLFENQGKVTSGNPGTIGRLVIGFIGEVTSYGPVRVSLILGSLVLVRSIDVRPVGKS
jgi:hypothetical protein